MADNNNNNTKVIDVLTLRRTAKEAKRHVIVMRVLGLLVIILVAIIAQNELGTECEYSLRHDQHQRR
ncbi:hypothetical protein [uncultured Ruminococcus sp.]|uniref:hypothetical protein n=1 Tax=uncultured Ruminococcus sp. TaxID=165186 RepID=UPI0025F27849|nr:hypothetical protein [uncultured Ruminococcus sp.]